jgi:aminopeptidase YwaD
MKFGEYKMDREILEENAFTYLKKLCHHFPNRRVGAEGNRLATQFFADSIASFNFSVETPEFYCIDWRDQGAHLLTSTGETFDVFSSPYTLSCEVKAPLMVVRTLEELQACKVGNSILLLVGEIAREQLMPKEFPFYNPKHHQQIYQLLESKEPLAIITATARNPELAGALYPFPMIEDGDFNIPSVYMKDVDGDRLADYIGQEIMLAIHSERIPATGQNVIGRMKPEASRKIVLCAHIDAKDNTPGALDNGTGVVVLMLLAELLQEYSGELGIELLAFNGEDHYSAQGHKEYLKAHLDKFPDILLAINTDVAGYIEGSSAFSLYGCSDPVETVIRQVMSGFESLIEGEQWFQSDHSVFIQQGCPAAAITSDRFMELSTHITHTPKDDLNLVEPSKIVDVALALHQVINKLNKVILDDN